MSDPESNGLQPIGHARRPASTSTSSTGSPCGSATRPIETAEQRSELAALAAALPQAFSRLSSLLGLALECPVLSMDTMTAESDTAMAIGVPGSTWARRAGYAVDPHKLLEAAHQATVHAVSKGVDDGQESMPWDEP